MKPKTTTLLLLLAGCGKVLGSDLRIKTIDEFITFSKNRSSFSGTTVFLDSDIDLSGKEFEPINFFQGTFDGQGHAISNLILNSTSRRIGLFDYSNGLVIRNIVIDKTCSFTSSYTGNSADIGALIGTINGDSTIENVVNMASVTFNGNPCEFLDLGGIVGSLFSSSSAPSTMRNCANYGSITHSGMTNYSDVGGVAGNCGTDGLKVIQNCMNYGTITHSGKTATSLELGGITGYAWNTRIENFLSAGEIALGNVSTNKYFGALIGDASDDTSLTYSFFTSDVGSYNIYGSNTNTNKTGTPTSSTSISDAVNTLNSQVTITGNDWNKWLSNPNKATVSFRAKNNKEISLASQAILLPDLAGNSKQIFSGWFIDEMLTSPFTSSEVQTGTILYGEFCILSNYTVTLDMNGGSELSMEGVIVECNGLYRNLPKPSRTGHSFVGWFTERDGGDKVESGDKVTNLNNHILYAHWEANKYTVTFVNDGTTIKNETLEYGSTIAYPDTPSKTGYAFNGWNSTIQTVPAHDLTIAAVFFIRNYTITFEPNGGSACDPITQSYGTTITLPTPSKAGNSFEYWSRDEGLETRYTGSTIPDEDLKLYAKWTINNYTVTFDANGGSKLPVKEIEVTFGSSYGALPTPTKEGFTFLGWFTEDNVNVTSETTVTITRNHTLTAKWNEIVTAQVEIVFETKELSEKKIEEIIEEYTDAGFEIVKIEESEFGELKVIVKFVDDVKAEEFVRSIRESSNTTTGLIKKVGFDSIKRGSFSPILCPVIFFAFVFGI